MSCLPLGGSDRALKSSPGAVARRSIPTLVFFLLALTLTLSPTTILDAPASAQVELPGHEREIGGGEIHSYHLTLAPRQFVRAVFDQRGVDVVVTLLDARGAELMRVDSPTVGSWGAESVFFEAATGGDYFLQVRPRRPAAAPGRYEFDIETQRADAPDGRAFAAERAFAEAGQLTAKSADARTQGLEKYNEALRLFRAAGDTRGVRMTLTTIAALLASTGEEQNAFPYLDEALSLAVADGDRRGEADTRSNIAKAYLSLGDRDRALEYFKRALQLYQAAGDNRMAAYTLIAVGTVHDQAGDRKESLENYNLALPLFRAAEDQQGVASTLNNIGLVYDALGEKKQARDYYEQAIALFRTSKPCWTVAPSLSNVAFDALGAGDKQKAIQYLDEALTIQRSTGDRAGQGKTLNNIGFVYNS
ncbi:MAG TPA: tetratricopeptide repeat protein, partial [Pyrinomonadaceae bacterium]|nr:tetratricopeptide repeat protein [Pyrinomonadaceae bacterium]